MKDQNQTESKTEIIDFPVEGPRIFDKKGPWTEENYQKFDNLVDVLEDVCEEWLEKGTLKNISYDERKWRVMQLAACLNVRVD